MAVQSTKTVPPLSLFKVKYSVVRAAAIVIRYAVACLLGYREGTLSELFIVGSFL